MTLKELLKSKLTEKQLAKVPSSFDIIGNKDKAVAIIDIPKELTRKSKVIASALMQHHKNVKSVFLKASERKGIYRLRKLRLIAGSRDTEVIHAEYGCRFILDTRKVYFSPRESTERLRVSELVKEGEIVIVFFAGIGPFPIIIAKKSKAAKIIGIEINPVAVGYFRKNIELNKTNNVEAILGDVKEKAAGFYGICDRVIMPLPETAIDYIGYAAKCLKTHGFIHLYRFCEENKIRETTEEVAAICKELKVRSKISSSKVLPYGPKIYKYRLDIKIF